MVTFFATLMCLNKNKESICSLPQNSKKELNVKQYFHLTEEKFMSDTIKRISLELEDNLYLLRYDSNYDKIGYVIVLLMYSYHNVTITLSTISIYKAMLS